MKISLVLHQTEWLNAMHPTILMLISLVVMIQLRCQLIPPSRVRANRNSSVSNYSFIRGSFDSCITRSINDILKSLKIKITTDKSDDIKTISTETPHVSNTTTDEFIHALLDGLYDLEVHNDVGSMPTEKETTRFTVVQALQ